MVFTAKIEQMFTHRPNSYVPRDTTANLLNLDRLRRTHPDVLNHTHHFTMGLITAPIRSIMSFFGVIGPMASLGFLILRITADQVVEIVAGASAAPWTWPINEQWIDIGHKAVFATIVGYLTDKFVRGVDWFN
jgi:hypothetical protein